MNPNLIAFLMMIRRCEGTDGPDGYRMMFGGRLFDSFADHPRITVKYTNKAGKTINTSAAGAYQFIIATWDGIVRQIHLPDFTPANQDAGAAYLIKQAGAMQFVEDGDLQRAIDRCAHIWASLPGSNVDQPMRPIEFAVAAYVDAGGMLA